LANIVVTCQKYSEKNTEFEICYLELVENEGSLKNLIRVKEWVSNSPRQAISNNKPIILLTVVT
jgi:hypothetical protein